MISKTHSALILLCITNALFSSQAPTPHNSSDTADRSSMPSYRVVATAAYLRQSLISFKDRFMQTNPELVKATYEEILAKKNAPQENGYTELEELTASNKALQPITAATAITSEALNSLPEGPDKAYLQKAFRERYLANTPPPLTDQERLNLATIMPALKGTVTIPGLESQIREYFPEILGRDEEFILPPFRTTKPE